VGMAALPPPKAESTALRPKAEGEPTTADEVEPAASSVMPSRAGGVGGVGGEEAVGGDGGAAEAVGGVGGVEGAPFGEGGADWMPVGMVDSLTQPWLSMVSKSMPGNVRSALRGIHCNTRSAGSMFRRGPLEVPPLAAEASLQRQRCQKATTTDVQIGGEYQHCWISSKSCALSSLCLRPADLTAARMAVV